MKLFSLMMVAAFAIGCGGKQKSDTTTSNTTTTNTQTTDATKATGEGTPCTQEIALVCPDGQTDACLKTPADGDTHKCVAK